MSKGLVFAGFTALALSTTACSDMKSAFGCGPAAYRNGPVGHDNQPMVAAPCDGSKQIAGWAGLPAAPSAPAPTQASAVPQNYATYPSHVAWEKPAVANEAVCRRLSEAEAAQGAQSGYVLYPSHVAYIGNCRPAS
jgi:hypothetical protein